MKYLKYFESLSHQSEWGLILSPEDFIKVADEFDSIIEPYLEYADMGYELSFETAYGSRVFMNYDDYLKKTDKYKEFINGLHVRGSFFTSKVKLPYDYNVLIEFLKDVQVSIDRLGDNGWVMKEFEVKGLKESTLSSSKPRITVSHEFNKGTRTIGDYN